MVRTEPQLTCRISIVLATRIAWEVMERIVDHIPKSSRISSSWLLVSPAASGTMYGASTVGVSTGRPAT